MVLAACLVVSSSLPAGATQVSDKQQSKWEYKAVNFFPEKGFVEHTKQMNDLASGGWEYAGLIIPPYDSNDRYKTKSVVAFRRPK